MKQHYLITPTGNFKHEEGMQVIDSNTIKRIMENLQEEQKNIAIDFAHESFSKADFSKAGELLTTSLKRDEEGLWGKIVWSEKAKKKIKDSKFGYLSPVFKYNPKLSKNKKLFIEKLVSIGLTNHPNIPAMKPLLNQIEMEEFMEDFLTKLKKTLELPDNASLEEISSKLFNSLGELTALKKKEDEAKVLDKQKSQNNNALEVSSTAETNVAQNSLLPTMEEWSAAKKKLSLLENNEIERRVNDAIQAGKILPAQKDWAFGYANSDSAGFDNFLANSIATVQMGGMINRSSKPASTKSPLSETQEKINSLLGISTEEFNKFN